MADKSVTALKALIDTNLPSSRSEEPVKVSELRQFLFDFLDSTVNNTDGGGLAASLTEAGVAEVATVAETNVGSDASRMVSPDGLAGSYAGTIIIEVHVFGTATDVATGDGKRFFHIPASIDGMNIVSVHALNHVAGITGQCDVQIYNVTTAADILSTVLSVDSTETGSHSAATPAVIDTAEDDLATNDILRIDVDAIHSGTAPKGLTITIECRLP